MAESSTSAVRTQSCSKRPVYQPSLRCLLGFLGFYSLIDFLKLRKAPGDLVHTRGKALTDRKRPRERSGCRPSCRLRRSRRPSLLMKISYPGGRRYRPYSWPFAEPSSVSLLPLWRWRRLSDLPNVRYILGVSSFTTVGTDILQIIFTAG